MPRGWLKAFPWLENGRTDSVRSWCARFFNSITNLFDQKESMTMTDPTPKTTSDPTAKTTTAFAGQVGAIVLYQPSVQEWPMGHHQHPAIVTAWDADNLQANLMLFFDNFQGIRTKTGVSEGTGDGTFQQLGTPSTTQQAINHAKEEAKTAASPPTTAPPTTPPPAPSTAAQKQSSHV